MQDRVRLCRLDPDLYAAGMSDAAEWRREFVERVGKAVQAARGKRSAQWLADRTAEIGTPISRTAISNLENGRKGTIDLADLTVLAAALRVPPVQLIFPDLIDGPVEVIPNVTVDSHEAMAWFTGEDWAESSRTTPVMRHLDMDADGNFNDEQIAEAFINARPVNLARALRIMIGSILRTESEIERAQEASDDKRVSELQMQVANLESSARTILDTAKVGGLTVRK